MNLKMKLLVGAAVASMALSGGANAAFSNTQTGDSSLILTLISNTDAVSASFDLGFLKSTFDQTTSYSWDLTSGAYASAYSSFFAAVTNTSNIKFAVFAGDSTGSGVGEQSLFTTVATTWTNTSGSTLGQQLRNFDNTIDKSAVTGSSATFFEQATGGLGYAGVASAYGTSGKINVQGGVATVAYGNNANVFNVVRASTNNLTNATATKLSVDGFNPYFSLGTDGTLSYVAAAPVPEADTWAMLLGGFALMGFIARRRTSFEVV